MILLEVTHSLTSALTVCLVGGRESARERERERAHLFILKQSKLQQMSAAAQQRDSLQEKDSNRCIWYLQQVLFHLLCTSEKLPSGWFAKFDSDLLPFEEINFQSEVDHFRLKIGWSYSCLWMILDPFCILEKMWLHESFWAAWSEKVNKELGWVSKGRISALIMI